MFISQAFSMPEVMQQEFLAGGHTLNLISPDLSATLVPYVYNADAQSLTMHLAKANPQTKLTQDTRCLAIIDGVQGYISPSYYPSKQETGKVVPTWDYCSLHVYGKITIHEDILWLREHVNALTNKMEHSRVNPWKVDDAPERYINTLLKAIVGVELHIYQILAKAKLSQNKNYDDQKGVIAGLYADGNIALSNTIHAAITSSPVCPVTQ